MDKLSLEARIEAELISYAGKMCVYVNDFKGNTIEIGADEKFETASCIKSFILADLFNLARWKMEQKIYTKSLNIQRKII